MAALTRNPNARTTAAIALLGVFCVSCSTTRPLAVAVPEPAKASVGWSKPVKIVGYTTTDGRVYELDGNVLDKGDTLVFSQVSRMRVVGPGRSKRTLRVPRDSVGTINVLVPEFSAGKTAAAAATTALLLYPLIIGFWVLGYIASGY